MHEEMLCASAHSHLHCWGSVQVLTHTYTALCASARTYTALCVSAHSHVHCSLCKCSHVHCSLFKCSLTRTLLNLKCKRDITWWEIYLINIPPPLIITNITELGHVQKGCKEGVWMNGFLCQNRTLQFPNIHNSPLLKRRYSEMCTLFHLGIRCYI